jgi:Domain of unknown function (DUF4872)/Butirosin biosynthesis protein H, N-terminal
MTAHKHLKQLIRARMEKTGERYSAARRFVVESTETAPDGNGLPWHFAGSVPATTTLRSLLTHAGVRAPHTGKPFSEAMLFGIAGGIGIGVMTFHYAKADTATFFLGGRHHWYDEKAYLTDTLEAFEIEPVIRETSGARTAEKQLQEMLADYGPCAAWVENYRVLTVYSVDAENGAASIGDMTDEPAIVPIADLTKRRLVVKQQKCRLLGIPPSTGRRDLKSLIEGGLRRCVDGFLNPGIPQMKKNAQLAAIQTWAERMHGVDGKESWSRVFKPGPNLWRGLSSIYTFIEHFGSGGGLARPIFADFLREASTALKRPELAGLAERYATLGRQWSDLADAALPDSVPELRAAKTRHTREAEARHEHLGMLNCDADFGEFPLSEAQSDRLRAELKDRIVAIHAGETAAFAELQRVAGRM